MVRRVEPLHARPRSESDVRRLNAGGWPDWLVMDRAEQRRLKRVLDWFGEFELVVDDTEDGLLATGWGAPISWTGEVEDVPAGFSDALKRSVSDVRGDAVLNTFVMLAAHVRTDMAGQGLGSQLLAALRDRAHERGWTRVLCPARPTLKSRYPLTPIEEYMTWRRDDGAPFDPWLRTHHRLGAQIIAAAPESQSVRSTVAQWQRWTGMSFPASGEYVIPGGLSVLSIDRDRNIGSYVEPNVWVRYPDPDGAG